MPTGGVLAILDSLTGGEVLIILVAALLVLGPERLPDTARTMGQWVAKLKTMTSGLQSEVREVLDDPAMQPIREVGEFVAAPRKKLMEFATAAEAEAAEAKRRAEEAAEAAKAAEDAAAAARAEVEAAQAEGLMDGADGLMDGADGLMDGADSLMDGADGLTDSSDMPDELPAEVPEPTDSTAETT